LEKVLLKDLLKRTSHKEKEIIVMATHMWHLFKMGTTYDPWSHALTSGEWNDLKDDKKRTLDPHVSAGCFNIERAKSESLRQNVTFTYKTACILTEDETAKRELLKETITTEELEKGCVEVKSNPVFWSSIVVMMMYGAMIGVSSDANIIAFAKYFQVAKGEDRWRAIADSRRAGLLTKSPAPTNLPFIKTILTEIGLLGSTFAVIADVKHAFSTLRICPWLQNLFGISCDGRYAKLQVVPQGFKHSPRWCQCMMWMLVIHREDGEPDLGLKETWGEDPPSIVYLQDNNGKTVGL